MNSMVRERESRAVPLFIAITPEIRRALELLAEASISLLDEIDAPTDALEVDGEDEPSLGWITTARGVLVSGDNTDDREFDDSDDEDADPAEDSDHGEQNGDLEHDLGWTADGQLGDWDAGEADFLPPEASGEFNPADYQQRAWTAAQKATFKIAPRRARPLSRSLLDEQLRLLRLKLQKMRKR